VTDDEAIWVVCKTMKVAPTDLDMAIKLTQTSNTQTPVSGKDLRAVDQIHVRLENWLDDLGVIYTYRRGGRSPRGADVVQMKDLAQACVACWREDIPALHVLPRDPLSVLAGKGVFCVSDETGKPFFIRRESCQLTKDADLMRGQSI